MDDDNKGQYPLLGDLVLWPLLLITCGAAMTVLLIETWVGRQAGNDWWQAATQNLDKPVYTAFLCVIVGNTVRLAKEGIMWLTKEKSRFREQVAAEVAERVTAEVTARVAAEVREQIASEVEARVVVDVTERVGARVAAEVAAQVGAERDKAWAEWLKSQNILPPDTPPQLSAS